VRRHGADPETTVRRARDTAELFDRAQADEMSRAQEALTHEQNRRGATRQQVRVIAMTHQ
jgi:hypothetical protein